MPLRRCGIAIDREPNPALLECVMYAFCRGPTTMRSEALARLRALLLQSHVRTGDCDFSRVIAQAKRMNHPEANWLESLAEVLSGRAEPVTLNDWETWTVSAMRSPISDSQ